MSPQLSMVGKPPAAEVPARLPLKKYPHLRRLVNEIEFICSNCSSGTERVYITFKEARREPLVAPPDPCTRFVVLCPMCQCAPESGAGGRIQRGMLDLLQFPIDYRKPQRSKAAAISSLSGDDGMDLLGDTGENYATAADILEEEEKAAPRRKPKLSGAGTKKKVTDLNTGAPKSVRKRKATAKKKKS